MKGAASSNPSPSENTATVANGGDAALSDSAGGNTEHHSGSKKKTTHLQSKKCSFACVERELSIGDMSLLTFEKGKHVHSCKQHNLHMLPLDPSEQLLLLRLLMAFPSVKELWQKVVEPAIARCQQNGRIPTRLLNLTEADLSRYAKRWGLSNRVSQGEPDFARLLEILIELQNEGATIAYKVPGYAVDSPRSILHDSAKPFLQTDDLFIFVMTRLQVALLKQYGQCVSTDGTHAVFSYNNIKVIVVLVGSSASAEFPDVKERGFPVVLALTTSEREDIHKAIVAHIVAAVGPDWKPQLLMTDMAFSAFNAWCAFFPSLRWLWCKFHVWQAWIKKLSHMARPDGLSKAEFSILKGKLIKEIKELISPSDEPSMTGDEFTKRSKSVSDVLWGAGLTEIAAMFDVYIKNATRWSPPARRAAVEAVFGSIARLPMITITNNSLERFFGILKYVILAGVAAKTVSDFIAVWRLYMTRIYLNALRSNVLRVISARQAASARPCTGVTEASEMDIKRSSDTDVFGNDDVEQGEDDAELSSEDDTSDDALDSDREEDKPAVEDFAAIKRREDELHREALIESISKNTQDMNHICSLLTGPDRGDISISQLTTYSRMVASTRRAGLALASGESYSGSDLAFSTRSSGFVQQRNNFDTATFTPVATAAPFACKIVASSSCAIPHQAGVQSIERVNSIQQKRGDEAVTNASMSLPQTGQPLPRRDPAASEAACIHVPDAAPSLRLTDPANPRSELGSIDTPSVSVTHEVDQLNVDVLRKPKRAKRTIKERSPEWLAAFNMSFAEFANSFLTDEVKQRIAEQKAIAENTALPLLRTALSWNTCNRIRAIAHDLFNIEFPKTSSKGELLSKLIAHILDLLPKDIPQDIVSAVADVGVVHTSHGHVERCELLLLQANGTSNSGESCVAACENLMGWVVRKGAFVRVDMLSKNCLYWARLVERRKELTIFN